MKQICRYLLLSLFVLLLSGCSKDNNPVSGTSWESRNASGLWSYSHYNDGDFAEVLKFDDDQVHDIITRDGHTYYDKGWYKYRYDVTSDGREQVYISYGDDETICTIYDNTMYRNLDIFYKQ